MEPRPSRRGARHSVNCAALHDELHSASGRDVARWITLDSDEIGEQAWLDGAQPILPMQHLRIDGCRGAQCLYRRHAVIDHQLELTRIVAVSEDADVAAVADWNARVHCGPEARLLFGDARQIGIDAAAPAAIRQNRIAR